MPSSRALCLSVCLAALVGCKDPKGGEIQVRQAQVVPTTKPLDQSEPFIMDRRYREDEIADLAAKSAAAKKPAKDLQKGDKQDAEWIPKENTSGASRWKDTGVYVDGQPVGFLSWGELPLGLKPVWLIDKVSANKRPGTNDLGWRWARQRYYRFTDYLAAVGVDVRKVKELHVYGPKFSETNIVTQQDLQSPDAKNFYFRFGSNVSGKAIPQIPDEFGNGRTPDKISAVMVYIDKKPPTLVPNMGLELDGVPMTGVPYGGEPIRGGIRVYLDDRLATIIKRQELDPKQATKNAEGELVWSLPALLAKQGVDTSKVVEVWSIRDERRGHKWPGAALKTMTFEAAAQSKVKGGGIVLHPEAQRTNHIALHTKPVTAGQLPVITPDDD